ncbi:MAG: Asp-tRNA(Asn)/Glu-tRNA(Gln) amidotransferase subunit GatB, partial [Clostridia bacterium]|nr:Asp-tRNA(Asn)/Glu-tRNA(Gln) amidotransferase subunit GatB [Clostridia bacterium]
MEYEVVMGLEVHVELGTKTKLFCSCPNTFSTEPNISCCPKCAALPGAVGSLNEKAIELASKAGLSLDCTIQNNSRFDRKHYFYPDLAAAFQTTQFYRPICVDGHVDLSDGSTINIKQIHIEEDAGKLVHDPYIDASYVDYNRCSRCLIEIVSQPDFRRKEQVLEYLDTLRSRLIYAGVSSCKMEEGIMRCDINLSVREKGAKEFGVRTEIKNMASFRSIERAIESEAKRHIKCIEAGEKLIQETRGWNDETGQTFAMREKEYAVDYRYFPD